VDEHPTEERRTTRPAASGGAAPPTTPSLPAVDTGTAADAGGGRPAAVEGTGSGDDPGMQTAKGQESRFNKLVSREGART
jgi:hypothetical protein